jgi:branched-chain amino acid transport system permease protein
MLKSLRVHAGVVIAAVLVVLVADQLSSYNRFLAGQLAVLIITSLGLSILVGTAGQLSLASAAFLGIGAYGVPILMTHHWPLLAACVGVLVGAWLLGSVLGLVSLRLDGFYLAIVTFGFLAVFDVFIAHGGTLTGGSLGLVAPLASIGSTPLTSDNVAVAALVIAVVGAAATLIKVDPKLAALTGIPTVWMKSSAFALSAVFAAVAGILQVFLLGTASPASYSVSTSIQDLTVVVVGGLAGSALGTVVAAIVLFEVPYLVPALGTYSDYFYAALLLVVLAAFPTGLGGVVEIARRRARILFSRKATA